LSELVGPAPELVLELLEELELELLEWVPLCLSSQKEHLGSAMDSPEVESVAVPLELA